MILKPDYNLKSLFDIDIEALRQKGVEALLFDLDSTVMASGAGVYCKKVYSWLCELKKDFKIAVVSNNTNEKYLDNIRRQSCFDVIGNAKKPATKVTLDYLNSIEVKPENTVVIGDRPLTDIMLGKKLGAATILVDSITCDTEHKIVRFVRALERLVIRR